MSSKQVLLEGIAKSRHRFFEVSMWSAAILIVSSIMTAIAVSVHSDQGALVAALVGFPAGLLYIGTFFGAPFIIHEDAKLFDSLANKQQATRNNIQHEYIPEEYLITQQLDEYLSDEEKDILNWGIQFCTSETNVNKLVSTSYINHPLVAKRQGVRAYELVYELDNLPYELGGISKVFEKSANLAVRHKINDGDELRSLGLQFHNASNNIKKFKLK